MCVCVCFFKKNIIFENYVCVCFFKKNIIFENYSQVVATLVTEAVVASRVALLKRLLRLGGGLSL